MSSDPTALAATALPYPAEYTSDDSQARSWPWYLRVRPLLVIWAVLSVIWGLAVCYNICQRVSIQADMSRDVESDLDQGFVNASCTGPQCAAASSVTAQTQNWSGIASTYIKFGSDEMAESVFGPPAALLLIMLGTLFVVRRRPANAGRMQISN